MLVYNCMEQPAQRGEMHINCSLVLLPSCPHFRISSLYHNDFQSNRNGASTNHSMKLESLLLDWVLRIQQEHLFDIAGSLVSEENAKQLVETLP
mmetsp:Transcript_12660/g.31884  ORF Transcript_12660/g.31884 Transcript_12660/m.31884 type:complete len:94 (+) Transcript_12660:19-300(+)